MVAVLCNESELSHGKIEGLGLIRAEMNIFQSLRNKEVNQIVISLYDEEGKQIKNDSLKIYVNGTDMKYTVRKELYYTTTCYFLKTVLRPRIISLLSKSNWRMKREPFLGKSRRWRL